MKMATEPAAQTEQFSLIDLRTAVDRARSADHGSTGRLTTPLLSLPGLRLVLVSMRAGAEWPQHSTPGRITVQPLAGEIRMCVGDTEIALTEGKVAAFAAGVVHDVVAVTDAAFLLTVARPNLD